MNVSLLVWEWESKEIFMSRVASDSAIYSTTGWLLLFAGCLTSQQHASVSQGQICSETCTYCHTAADQTFYLTQ